MIVGSRTPVILDEWEDDDFLYRLVEKAGAFELERWWNISQKWSAVDDSYAQVLARRLVLRINLNNVEARRISFLAAALMRVLQFAEKLVDDAPGGMTRLTRGHLAAVKGVLLACEMPLERWEVELDGVEEDPETAEARRRLGLDVKPS